MQDTDSQTFSLKLPADLPRGKVALAIIFERTRSVVVQASVKPSAPQAIPVRWIGKDQGDLSVGADPSLEIELGGDLTPEETLELGVDVVGEPVRIHDWILLERRARPEETRKTKSLDGGDGHALDAIAIDRARTTDARISERRAAFERAKTTRAGIRERRREVLATDKNTHLRSHRLFFLQVDEWTDVTCLPRDPSNGQTLLPEEIKVPKGDVVLEALHPRTLGYELKLWTKQLARDQVERDLNKSPKDYQFHPAEWVAAMSQYLKAVLEQAFHRYFDRPVLKPDGVVDDGFRTAFEAFANGQLGEPNDQGLPESAILWPNSAYYFSFAAFAHVAIQFTKENDEKRFWEAVRPVFVYTADIYRRRFAPPPGHREYKDYNMAHINKVVGEGAIEKLRNKPADMASFRRILHEAFHGHP